MSLTVLTVFVAIDIVTGIMKATVTKKVNSKMGYKGFIRKAGIMLVIIIANLLDMLTGSEFLFRSMVVLLYWLGITYLQRIEMETKGIQLTQQELIIYLQENGLNPHDPYQADNANSQKAVYSTALSILESLANNPENFKLIKMKNMKVSQFSENLQRRINHLTCKVRRFKTKKDTDTFMLFL
jgi:toxin secretion/phage lysis holin